MGLDITAYSKIKPLRPYDQVTEDEWEGGDIISVFVSPTFKHAAPGLFEADLDENGKFVHADKDGDYAYIYDVSESEHFGWRAGSYSGYSMFRSELAELGGYVDEECWADPESYVNAPFFELVHFSDCEGSIGPVAAANLLEDFQAFRDIFRARNSDSRWELEKYSDFITGLTLAADNGVLDFH